MSLPFPDFDFSDRRFPDAIDHHKIVPLPVLLISGVSRIFPTFSLHLPLISRSCRLFPDASDRHKIVPLPVLSFPEFSDFFRLFPDASGRHKIVPLPVLLIISGIIPDLSDFARLFPFLFLSCPDFSDVFRRVPDASHRHKIDQAPCCLETETQQFVLLGITPQNKMKDTLQFFEKRNTKKNISKKLVMFTLHVQIPYHFIHV